MAQSKAPNSFTQLSIDADAALFEGHSAGLILTFHLNERPLKGLAGLMDWRLGGAISAFLKSGAVTGAPGECVYLPVARGERLFHLVLLGAGEAPAPGKRAALTPDALATLRKNTLSLKLERWTVSRSDFGGPTDDFLAKNLKGVPLCLVN